MDWEQIHILDRKRTRKEAICMLTTLRVGVCNNVGSLKCFWAFYLPLEAKTRHWWELMLQVLFVSLLQNTTFNIPFGKRWGDFIPIQDRWSYTDVSESLAVGSFEQRLKKKQIPQNIFPTKIIHKLVLLV